ncbi:MAG: peptidoglycan DD-metalloendopeptidase family protein [Eubacteriales bacterium]|nr:peptidoglycan DD-metalloendopeptidase family protein [Eubacteriales bacterium]
MKKKKILRSCAALLLMFALLTADFTPFTMVQDASAVTQAEIDALKGENDALAAQKAELEKELKSLQTEKSSALAQKTNIDKQIGVLQSQISVAERQIREYETLIAQTEQEIRENEAQEAAQYELFCTRVRAMEERGTISYWSVLFHSASFSDLLSAMDFVSEIMESDQRVIDELRELREQIEEKKASLETALAEQETAKSALVAKNSELKERQAAAEAVLNELKANETEYKKLVAAKEAEMERQQAEIIRLSRELAIQNGDTTETYGGYIWPCSSHYVTSPLGSRYTGIKGASTNHAGIDIGRVYYSTQVVAAKAGTVIISAYNQYRGNYVVVSHGSGNTTTYQHLSKRSVEVGQHVAQGQVVGVSGSTGVSSGPHLHFEISEGGKIVDPLKYLTNYTKGWK